MEREFDNRMPPFVQQWHNECSSQRVEWNIDLRASEEPLCPHLP
ncbi:hypothetical protein L917_01463, partial [Phytophthora nicotianae]